MTINLGNKAVSRNIWHIAYQLCPFQLRAQFPAFLSVHPKCNNVLLVFMKTCETESLQFKKLNLLLPSCHYLVLVSLKMLAELPQALEGAKLGQSISVLHIVLHWDNIFKDCPALMVWRRGVWSKWKSMHASTAGLCSWCSRQLSKGGGWDYTALISMQLLLVFQWNVKWSWTNVATAQLQNG